MMKHLGDLGGNTCIVGCVQRLNVFSIEFVENSCLFYDKIDNVRCDDFDVMFYTFSNAVVMTS